MIVMDTNSSNFSYTGKLMNSHSISTYNSPYPAGWNNTGCRSEFLAHSEDMLMI